MKVVLQPWSVWNTTLSNLFNTWPESWQSMCVCVSVCNQVIFPLLVLCESRSVNAQGDEPLLPLEQKKTGSNGWTKN